MRGRIRRGLGASVCILALACATAIAQDLVVLGTDGDDVLNGTSAAESLYGRAGNDTINAGAGDDELDGGSGADSLNGGPGVDVVSYGGPSAVSVSVNGVADDGSAGEGDNVGADVEDIYGGDGGDRLSGNGKANTIDGGAGDDRLIGAAGRDALFGGDGNDDIEARDGVVDRIDCGSGNDKAVVDQADAVIGCEDVDEIIITPAFGLSIIAADGILQLNQVLARSLVVVACVRGCRPSAPPSRAILTRRSVSLDRRQLVRLPLPRRISGATIEVGVRAPRSRSGRCVRFRVGRAFRSLTPLKSRCTTVAGSPGAASG